MGVGLEQTLVFLHGFLGQTTDWQPVIKFLNLEQSSYHCIELNNEFSISDLNFKNWQEAFQRWVQARKMSTPLILVGYSMGGRLINPLLEKGLAKKAIFLSSQFGLPGDDLNQRAEARRLSQAWAERFQADSWLTVTEAWNQQDIFKDTKDPVRDEKYFERPKLAAMLRGFSMGEQKDYSGLWQQKDLQLLFLAGENDPKYRALATEIQTQATNTKVRILKNAGHRLLLDQPQQVAQEILNFTSDSR